MEETDQKFVEYYAEASESPETLQRFRLIFDLITGLLASAGADQKAALRVADIGCGAGTQCMIWAKEGHTVSGLDINQELLEIARSRAKNQGLSIDIRSGSANKLPWPTGHFDVCLVPELLEHVSDWEGSINEACRVLKPGGLLFLTTTNILCPKQQEFKLIGYSWYPGWLKKKCVELSLTTKRHWVEYAEFPAIHWFSPYQLARELESRGFDTMDRFDLAASKAKEGITIKIATVITKIKVLRFLAHLASTYTMVVARKRAVDVV